jgi:hypothetical protein
VTQRKKKIAAAVEDEKFAMAQAILQKYGIGIGRRRSRYDSGYLGVRTPATAGRTPFENSIPKRFPPLGSAGTTPFSGYLFPIPLPYPRPYP